MKRIVQKIDPIFRSVKHWISMGYLVEIDDCPVQYDAELECVAWKGTVFSQELERHWDLACRHYMAVVYQKVPKTTQWSIRISEISEDGTYTEMGKVYLVNTMDSEQLRSAIGALK